MSRPAPGPMCVLRAHIDSVNAVDWHADGDRLASGSSDNTVQVWSASTRRSLATFVPPPNGAVGSTNSVLNVAFCSRELLLSQTRHGLVSIWDVPSDSHVPLLSIPSGMSTTGSLSPRFLSGSGPSKSPRSTHASPAVSPRGSPKRSPRASPQRSREPSPQRSPRSPVASPRLPPTMAAIAGAGPPPLSLTPTATSALTAASKADGWTNKNTMGHIDTRSFTFCKCAIVPVQGPNSWLLAIPSSQNEIGLWDLRAANMVRTLSPDSGGAGMCMAIHVWGRSVIGGFEDGMVRSWDLTKDALFYSHKFFVDPVMALEVDSEGNGACASTDTEIATFRVSARTGVIKAYQPYTFVSQTGGIGDLCVRQDGRVLAAAGSDHRVRLFDWKRPGRSVGILQSHSDGVTGVKFSPDGSTLASCSKDKSIALWTNLLSTASRDP